MVKVARVDLERAKIDFTLDEVAASGERESRDPPRPAFAEPLARSDRPPRGRRARR
jgi:hypothetical protein